MKEFYPFFVDYIPLIISNVIVIAFFLSILPDAEEEYMEISNLVKEPDFPYGQEYISLLARQGKIDAHKEGKNWHTSKAAVTNYILNRKRKRHLQ